MRVVSQRTSYVFTSSTTLDSLSIGYFSSKRVVFSLTGGSRAAESFFSNHSHLRGNEEALPFLYPVVLPQRLQGSEGLSPLTTEQQFNALHSLALGTFL